jgi:hypothetical protein
MRFEVFMVPKDSPTAPKAIGTIDADVQRAHGGVLIIDGHGAAALEGLLRDAGWKKNFFFFNLVFDATTFEFCVVFASRPSGALRIRHMGERPHGVVDSS